MSVNFVAVFVADVAEETRFCGATTREFALRWWWVFVTSASGILIACVFMYMCMRACGVCVDKEREKKLLKRL